jgi:hypothetical protein
VFEKSQKAVTDLSVAVTEDVNQSVAIAKAVVVPAVAGFFGSIATLANKVQAGVADGSLFKAAEAKVAETVAAKPEPAPFPTPEQNAAIKTLRALGRTDDEIAGIVGVTVLTVKQAA